MSLSWPASSAKTCLGVTGQFCVFPPSQGRVVTSCGVCLRENKLTSAISDSFLAPLSAFGDRTVRAGRGRAAAAAWGSVTVRAPERPARPCAPNRARRTPGDGAGCHVPFLLSPCEAEGDTQVPSCRARHRPALSDPRAHALSPSFVQSGCRSVRGEAGKGLVRGTRQHRCPFLPLQGSSPRGPPARTSTWPCAP